MPDTIGMLTSVFQGQTLAQNRIRVWYRKFENGHREFGDAARSGRPRTGCSAANIGKVVQSVSTGRNKSIDTLAQETGVGRGSVHRILQKDLRMKKRATRMVPHVLTPIQRQQRLHFARDFLRRVHRERGFLDRIVTVDESWVWSYDPLSKVQSAEWRRVDEPRGITPRRPRNALKLLLVAFFDRSGMIHQEFLRQNMDSDAYIAVLGRFLQALARVRPAIRRTFLLHDDNASCHRSRPTNAWKRQEGVVNLPHPPHSPDLAPCDFFLFPRIKRALRGQRFTNHAQIQTAVNYRLQGILQNEFRATFISWQHRCRRCIASAGAYFEGLH